MYNVRISILLLPVLFAEAKNLRKTDTVNSTTVLLGFKEWVATLDPKKEANPTRHLSVELAYLRLNRIVALIENMMVYQTYDEPKFVALTDQITASYHAHIRNPNDGDFFNIFANLDEFMVQYYCGLFGLNRGTALRELNGLNVMFRQMTNKYTDFLRSLGSELTSPIKYIKGYFGAECWESYCHNLPWPATYRVDEYEMVRMK